jgi:hypothetical protein
MQFLVDATVDKCVNDAREFFSKEWPYAGSLYHRGNHAYFVEPYETWWQNISEVLKLAILGPITLGLYWLYYLLKPTSDSGSAHVLAASEGNRTRLLVVSNKMKYQRALEGWVKREFPAAEVIAPQDEKPIDVEAPPLKVQPVSKDIDVPEQIKKLAELRDSGLITGDEFEAKKADLLNRM